MNSNRLKSQCATLCMMIQSTQKEGKRRNKSFGSISERTAKRKKRPNELSIRSSKMPYTQELLSLLGWGRSLQCELERKLLAQVSSSRLTPALYVE
jgi:hypothetical protein